VEKDIQKVNQLLKENPDFEVVLENKEFQRTKMAAFVREKLNLSQPTISFLEHLVQQHQIRLFKTVINDFIKLLKSYRKEIDAHLTLAKPMSDQELESFKKEIREKYLELKPDEKLNLIIKIDPNLKGGFELYAKGNYVDMSLSRRLRSMLTKLKDEEIASFMNPDYLPAMKREKDQQLIKSIGNRVRKLTN